MKFSRQYYKDSSLTVAPGKLRVSGVSMPMVLRVLTAGAVLSLAISHGRQDAPGTIFHSDTRVVVCPTTVVDRSGHLVDGLQQNAFTVFENNVRQQIKVFKHEDIPVSMGLIIDSSASMHNKRAKVEAAALALVKASNPDDEVFVVHFNDDVYLDNPAGKDFLTSIEEMQKAITRPEVRGGTAMRNAIQMSIDWLHRAHKDKKVLVVVTDGEDNASDEEHNSLEQVVRSARQNEVLIYSVGLLSEEDHHAAANAKRQLNTLSEATGGEAFFPSDVAEVDRIAHQVARDLRNQYTIEYSPTNPAMDGTFRKIRVAVKASSSATARTRTGYYATPERGGAASSAPAANFRR